MPKTFWLIAASAALAAAPVAAQNNADQAVTNDTAVTVANDTNVAVDANLVAATPPADNAMEPAAPTESELATGAADDDDDGRRGFPWGLVGLVGLIGLLGRRKAS